MLCADKLPPKNSEPFIVTDGEGFYSVGYSNWLYRTPERQLRMPECYGKGMNVNYWMPIPEESLWTLCSDQLLPESKQPYVFADNKDGYAIGYSRLLIETNGKYWMKGRRLEFVLRWTALTELGFVQN